MKVKIFTTSSWNASNLESEANRWLEKNDVDIIDIKIAGTQDRAIFVLMYEEKPAASMSVEEAMIEAARAGAILTRNNDVPKESPKPSPCGFCSLCPADSNVCPITGKDINKVDSCFEKKIDIK